MGVANTSPPTPTSLVLTCISTPRWASCCTAETCDIGGSVRCHPPPVLQQHAHLAKESLTPYSSPYTSQFLVSSLLEHKGGVCVRLGGRCCISDLPLLEIRFGDIRMQGFGCAPPPPTPPAAERAIMPSMSNHFSIKKQISTSLSLSIVKYCPVEEQTAGSGGAIIP